MWSSGEILQIPLETRDQNPNVHVLRDAHTSQPHRSHIKLKTTLQSPNPHDLNPLISGHFLVGGPIVTIAEADLTTTPMNRLRQWKLLTLFHQSFWTGWASEYLASRQNLTKWIRPQLNIEVRDLVILWCPNSPPTVEMNKLLSSIYVAVSHNIPLCLSSLSHFILVLIWPTSG